MTTGASTETPGHGHHMSHVPTPALAFIKFVGHNPWGSHFVASFFPEYRRDLLYSSKNSGDLFSGISSACFLGKSARRDSLDGNDPEEPFGRRVGAARNSDVDSRSAGTGAFDDSSRNYSAGFPREAQPGTKAGQPANGSAKNQPAPAQVQQAAAGA